MWVFYKLKQLVRLIAKNMSSSTAKCVKSRPGFLYIEVLETYFFFNLLNFRNKPEKKSLSSSPYPQKPKVLFIAVLKWKLMGIMIFVWECFKLAWLGCLSREQPGYHGTWWVFIFCIFMLPVHSDFFTLVQELLVKYMFSSVTQLCLTLLDPVDYNTPGFPCPSPTPSMSCSKSCQSSQWCHPTISSSVVLFAFLSVFPSIRVFSSESVLRIKWPKYWSFSFSISPSNEYLGLISFRIDWFDLLEVQRTLKILLQHHSSNVHFLYIYPDFFLSGDSRIDSSDVV